MSRKRNRVFKKANKSNNCLLLVEAKQLRNKCSKYGHFLKAKHVQDKLSTATTSKEVWKQLNNVIKGDQNPNNNYLIENPEDGKLVSDPLDVATLFNDHFIQSVESIINSSIASTNAYTVINNASPDSDALPSKKFCFHFVSSDEVALYLSNVKKCCKGDYSLKPTLIKLFMSQFTIIFTYIFNYCILKDIFPLLWKLFYVIPVPKPGNSRLITNYRPIAQLPNISKVFERILHKQLVGYLNLNGLLSQSQHGFRRHHSTTSAALDLLQYVYHAADSYSHSIAIFLDFSKAFDVINHSILMNKLKVLGLDPTSIALLQSYLSNRSQRVMIDGVLSSQLNTMYGVPQGSILGPLLFSLYINDMPKCLKHSKPVIYADDTTLLFAHKDINVLHANMTHDLNAISTYCTSNQLFINSKKCKYMFFYPHSDTDYSMINFSINGLPVQRVEEFNYLGITIDNYLKFESHCNKVVGKLNSASFITNKLRSCVPTSMLINLFNATGISHIIYGMVAYLPGLSSQSMKRLEKHYIDCGRNIIFNRQGISSEHVLQLLKWRTLE